jgi:signal transduction histidine kinase
MRQRDLFAQAVDLGALVGGCAALVGGDGPSVAVFVVVDSSSPWVLACPSQVEEIVEHLSANAREAMPDGGRLVVRLWDVHLDEARAAVLGVQPDPGAFVALSVADTGCGMAETTRAQCFEPFFTTKSGRAGLGLTVVHGIARACGWGVEVVSAPGRGTTVTLYLPQLGPSR